jgi:hypothetical protein
MAIGLCQFMTCQNMLGSSFRASFRLGSADRADYQPAEVLLCPAHERECRDLRDLMPTKLIMTAEGWIMSGLLLDAMGVTR